MKQLMAYTQRLSEGVNYYKQEFTITKYFCTLKKKC